MLSQAGVRRHWWIVLTLVTLTLMWRLVWLNTIPPHLYYDEAGQGLDARDVLHGIARAFFPRSMGKEPLYIYLSVPFVAVADTTPIAVRLPAALLGALTGMALFVAARALWGARIRAGIAAGVVAAALWMVNYWPHSVNRLGFRVNAFPVLLVLALAAWANWIRRPDRGRALHFGLLAGWTVLTYLAARITPVMWIVLFIVAVPPSRRRQLWPTVPWVFLGGVLGAAPLVLHFLVNPQDAVSRVVTFPVWNEARQATNIVAFFGRSLWDVLGGFFGWAGDPIPRHNLPGRPPFFPTVSALFIGGLGIAIYEVVRGEEESRFRALTLLFGWGILLIPAVLAAADNPHFLRLFGALPLALLLAANGAAYLWQLPMTSQWRRLFLALGFLLLSVEFVRTGYAYFYRWARQTDLYVWFQADLWTIGEEVRRNPEAIGIVPLNPFYGDTYREYVLEYVFRDVPILQTRVLEDSIEDWLQENLGNHGQQSVVVVTWHEGEHVNADPKDVLGFYLRREGTLVGRQAFRGFSLTTYRLGPSPQFKVASDEEALQLSFQRGVKLLTAQWGVAYPNPERTAQEGAAGTAVWAILTWELAAPQPDLKVTVDLVDAAGHRVASDERYLLDENRWPTSRWQPGTVARSYHLVMIPPTQPPGTLFLESRVYEGERLVPVPPQEPTPRGSVRWGKVDVLPALEYPSPESLPVEHSLRLPVTSGLTLLGIAVWPEIVSPGQWVTLRLFWHAQQPLNAPWEGRLVWEDQGPVATVRVPAGIPEDAVVHTDVDLAVPPQVDEGAYRIFLQGNGTSFLLGTLSVQGRPRSFTPPPIQQPVQALFGPGVQLLGMNDVYQVDNRLQLLLIWRVPGPQSRPLKRFVHVLGPDGRPIAQQDIVPCQGMCTASTWLPGEIIVDEVHVILPEEMPVGEYPVAVGWYDEVTLERLEARDAAGNLLPEGLLVLPITVRKDAE